jgi:thermostable 8-oxoguanine DNA glycosylase
MPVFYFLKGDELLSRETPDPEAEVMPDIRWGRFDVLFTPAYWMTQYWIREGSIPAFGHRLGSTFEEEVIACLLGGHGIPAEVGIAAFHRLRDRGVFESLSCSYELLSAHLKEPLIVGERRVTYRFWSQKARYIEAALHSLRTEVVPMESSVLLRDYLMCLPGVGPKTASWIVRNWLHSNEVAILDIHVIRAGLLMNLFSSEDKVEKDYMKMERRFLSFVKALEVEASHLDALFWNEMRSTPHIVSTCLTGSRQPQITGSLLHS